MKPICVDLFTGLHGWGEGFLAEGFEVWGFDLVDMGALLGVPRPPGITLVLQDVLTLHGSQFKDANAIVASPPCQKYSYMAMPWKKAKALAEWYRASPVRIAELNALFDACFRIQHQAIEAAGRYIPLIVENVKGAQPWVGRAQWHFGSYYLWGDIPALMPIPRSRVKVPGFNFHQHEKTGEPGGSFQSAAVKVTGQNWSRFAKTGEVSPHWRMEATKNDGGSWFAQAHNTASGKGQNPDGRLEAHRDDAAGVKQRNGGTQGWFGQYKPTGQGSRNFSSNSAKRKAASAQIAKIPFPLAQHIARCFR